MISYRIFYLLSSFFLLILSISFTSQYHGIGLAWKTYTFLVYFYLKSVDLGCISRSETFIWFIMSSLNFYSLSFRYLSCSFIIFAYRLWSLTCSGTYLLLKGFIDSWKSRSFYSSIYLSFCSLIDTFLFLSLTSKSKGLGIVTLNFFPWAKAFWLLIS